MLSRDGCVKGGCPNKLCTVGGRRVSAVAAEDAVELGNGIEARAIRYIGDGDSRVVEQRFGLFDTHTRDELCES